MGEVTEVGVPVQVSQQMVEDARAQAVALQVARDHDTVVGLVESIGFELTNQTLTARAAAFTGGTTSKSVTNDRAAEFVGTTSLSESPADRQLVDRHHGRLANMALSLARVGHEMSTEALARGEQAVYRISDELGVFVGEHFATQTAQFSDVEMAPAIDLTTVQNTSQGANVGLAFASLN